jgi:hypothetical protein
MFLRGILNLEKSEASGVPLTEGTNISCYIFLLLSRFNECVWSSFN